MIRVVIADDHTMSRAGLRALLATENDIEVVGEAADGAEAVAKCEELAPDVVVMDILMPVMNGIEATSRLAAECPATKVLVLSMYDDDEHVQRLLAAGAAGFVLKQASSDELVRAIREVVAGGLPLSPSVSAKVVRAFARRVRGEGTAFSTTFGVHGLRIGGGTGHKVYHNSVNLFGTLFGTAPTTGVLTSAFSVVGTGQTGLDVRNNAFANTLTGGTTSVAHVSIVLPSGGTSAMNLTLNNNGYYFGTNPATQGVGQAGTTAGTNFFTSLPALAAYSSTLSAAGTNDNASFAATTLAPFTSNTDLHIPASTVTQLESAGAAVGVTTDIDGEARSATTPYIGADEFAGVAVDLTPPSISYTPLGNTTFAANRTVAATIADLTGVPPAGGLQPRVSGTERNVPGAETRRAPAISWGGASG